MASFLLGKGITDDIPVALEGRFGNRYGLVAGATGTGKTVTLMTLAEGFSRLGVPVFLADVKATSPAWPWQATARPACCSAPRIWALPTTPRPPTR